MKRNDGMTEYLITYRLPRGEKHGLACRLEELPAVLKRLENCREEGYVFLGIKKREWKRGMYIDEGWEDYE